MVQIAKVIGVLWMLDKPCYLVAKSMPQLLSQTSQIRILALTVATGWSRYLISLFFIFPICIRTVIIVITIGFLRGLNRQIHVKLLE